MAEAQENIRPLSKSEKAAVLLLCMDEGTTSEMFSNMEDSEIKKIASALLNLNNIPTSHVQGVIEEFYKGLETQKEKPGKFDLKIDGRTAAANLIEKSLDPDRGRFIMENLSKPGLPAADKHIKFSEIIQQYPDEKIIDLIRNEHPQVVSIILANCKKKPAREALAQLPEASQVEVISRMAALKTISGKAMKDLQKYVMQKMSLAQTQQKTGSEEELGDLAMEGLDSTVKLLKGLKGEFTDKILGEVEKLDAAIGGEIAKKIFTVEDLERSNDVGIRELLRGVTNEDLKVALKNAPDTIKNKVFSNMSERAALILKEDMEVLPPLKVEDIELAQVKILKVAKDLIKEGKLILTEVVEED
ncbi:hypothetical protein K1X76_05170 [bacterium]|nr:hypothetical protein [bacterium]